MARAFRGNNPPRFPMKRLMISAFAAVALFAAATTMLRSHTPAADRAVGSADAMSLQELHTAPGVNKLRLMMLRIRCLFFSIRRHQRSAPIVILFLLAHRVVV